MITITLIGAILLVYSGIFSGFFQQDEWFVFGEIAGRVLDVREIFSNFFLSGVRHFNPLTDLLTILGYYLFKLNYGYWAGVSILLHIAATLLVYKFAGLLFKKRNLAFIAALIFALSSAHYQASTWMVVNIATQGAAIFGLISLILFLKFLYEGNLKRRNLYFVFSLVSILISLLFKEITIATILLFPVALKLFSNRNIKNKKTYLAVIFAFAIFYLSLRAIPFLWQWGESKSSFVSNSQSKRAILLNFLTLPASSLTQSIVPVEVLVSSSEALSQLFPADIRGDPGTTQNDIFVGKRLLVILSGIIFLIVTAITVLKHSPALVFAYLFIVLNSFVFLASPERTGIMNVIDSRNLYYLSIGSSLMVAVFGGYLFNKNRIIAWFIIVGVLALNILFLSGKIRSLSEAGRVRRAILDDIKSGYPDIPDRAIFFTQSDTSYYGLPEEARILPFQSGLGQTLLVWYNADENYAPEFFQDKFLWGISDQGYKEGGGRGFGYFRDFKLMAETLTKQYIPESSAIAFRYDSSSGEVTDITGEIRGRLEAYEVPKHELPMGRLSLVSSLNSKDINLIRDGRKETRWDSGTPYMYKQYIEIDLGKTAKIAQIKIDSYNNKDQSGVGYRVLLFGGDGVWREAFYAKRYPPDGMGIVDLYFKPQPASHVKIEQVGSHSFASWVIHELKLYEAVR